MSRDTKDFITEWIRENVTAEGYAAPGHNSRARQLADLCKADAKGLGISEHELDAAAKDMIGGGDDLAEAMANALESATDAEVRRLAEKDD